eukprot:1158282-Pelagomonas_calceolata.AAC.17
MSLCGAHSDFLSSNSGVVLPQGLCCAAGDERLCATSHWHCAVRACYILCNVTIIGTAVPMA